MSKKLILLRHAEALNNKFEEKDFDRSLSENGIKDLNNLSQFFIDNKIEPDLILASAAKRTTQTAKILAQALSIKEDRIILNKSLYNSSAAAIEVVINSSKIVHQIQTLILIAHNPGISELATAFTSQQTYIHLPPCGMMIFGLEIENWTDYLFHKTELLFQKFPTI